MALRKSRLFLSILSVGGLAGAVALGFGAPLIGRAMLPAGNLAIPDAVSAESAPVQVAEKSEPEAPKAETSVVRIDAPGTKVNVDGARGKVRVDAPHAQVNVDPDQGRVRVRAPYVNLDIRW